MKGNIKKLSVFVIVAAIAMFMVVGTALAGQLFPSPHSISGEYAVTGKVSFILTPFGFNADFTPINPAAVTSNSITCQGIFTFKRDGTGTFDTTGVLLVPPPQISPQVPHANAFHWLFTFTYNLADDGTITIDADENSFHVIIETGQGAGVVTFTGDQYSLAGRVSADHKTLVLGSPTTFIQTLTFSTGLVLFGIPNGSYVLTRVR